MTATRRARWPLEALSFAMADMQAGIGPFLGVFLQGRGWATGAIGTVMTIGAIAGMLMTAPAGALIDATRHKRWYVVVSGIFTVVASSLIWFSQASWVVALAQGATAIAGAAISPAMAGITLIILPMRGLFARVLAGTGRVNVRQGVVMTVQGVGASLSPAIGGWIVHFLGYHIAFLILGRCSLGSVALWLGSAGTMKPACAGKSDASLKLRSV